MVPFPKTQNDSSIEDVSLKPTRQEAVKKEPKSNATWDYWPLKCPKMTLSEKNWKMWDLEVDLQTVCQNCYSKWGGSRAFCDKNLQLCHLFVDSKAYGLPSYITTWLLKGDCWRWCIHLESQGSPNQVEGFTNGSLRSSFFGYSNSIWAPPTGNCPSILHWVVYGPWIEAFGIYNNMLKWNGVDWIISQTWIYHCTIWKLPWFGQPGVLGLHPINRSNPLPTMQHQATFRTAASFMPKSHPKSSANLKMVLDCPGLCFQNLYQNGNLKKYLNTKSRPGIWLDRKQQIVQLGDSAWISN